MTDKKEIIEKILNDKSLYNNSREDDIKLSLKLQEEEFEKKIDEFDFHKFVMFKEEENDFYKMKKELKKELFGEEN